MPIIYLDAGHGGRDSGAVGNGIREKDIVLDICKRIEKELKNYQDTKVILSRSIDEYITLEARTTQANKADADCLVSVHVNSAISTTGKGFETFTFPNSNSATKAFQNVMHQEIIKAIGNTIVDRGKKVKNLHVLRESKMKAILTENLFINNTADAKLLADPSFRQKIAKGHVAGLEKFLGLKRNAQPPPQEKSKIWVVQVGAFEDKTNALDLEKQLLKDGYKPFVREDNS